MSVWRKNRVLPVLGTKSGGRHPILFLEGAAKVAVVTKSTQLYDLTDTFTGFGEIFFCGSHAAVLKVIHDRDTGNPFELMRQGGGAYVVLVGQSLQGIRMAAICLEPVLQLENIGVAFVVEIHLHGGDAPVDQDQKLLNQEVQHLTVKGKLFLCFVYDPGKEFAEEGRLVRQGKHILESFRTVTQEGVNTVRAAGIGMDLQYKTFVSFRQHLKGMVFVTAKKDEIA